MPTANTSLTTTPANMPDPTPEAVILSALIIAIDDRETRKKTKPQHRTFNKLISTITEGMKAPLNRNNVARSRALAGAQAIMLNLDKIARAGK